MRRLHPKLLFIALLTVFLSSCAGINNVRDLEEEYITLKGQLVASPEPEDKNRRLILYFLEEGGTETDVKVCIAINGENSSVLKRLSPRLEKNEETLFLFAKPVKGQWEEYLEGVDYEVFAVGYYNPNSRRYVTVITAYGNELLDMLKSGGWKRLLKEIGKAAFKVAV